MKTQNKKNKILGGGEPNLRSKFGAKEFYFFYFGFSLAVITLLPVITAAQFNLPNLGNIKPTVSLNSDPLTPFPNSTVTISANLSGLIGAGGSNFVWFLNGARQSEASGLNKNTLTFKTGAIGAIYRVSVDVQTPSGELSDAINLTVGDFDLTWITNSRVPIFYRAKPMPTQNSIVAISALPFIFRPGTRNQVGSNNLIYNWMINGKMDPEKSGLNKSTYDLRIGDFPGDSYLVRLEVKTADGAVSLSKDVVIPVAKPRVLLYFSDPETDQPFGAALKNLSTKSTNLNFIAQPYFFTIPIEKLKWQWFINNAEVSGKGEKQWLATLKLGNDFSKALSAQVRVTAQNPNSELEIADSITNLEVR